MWRLTAVIDALRNRPNLVKLLGAVLLIAIVAGIYTVISSAKSATPTGSNQNVTATPKPDPVNTNPTPGSTTNKPNPSAKPYKPYYVELTDQGKTKAQITTSLDSYTKVALNTLPSQTRPTFEAIRKALDKGVISYITGERSGWSINDPKIIASEMAKAAGSMASSIQISRGPNPEAVPFTKLTAQELLFGPPMQLTYSNGSTSCKVELVAAKPSYLNNASCK